MEFRLRRSIRPLTGVVITPKRVPYGSRLHGDEEWSGTRDGLTNETENPTRGVLSKLGFLGPESESGTSWGVSVGTPQVGEEDRRRYLVGSRGRSRDRRKVEEKQGTGVSERRGLFCGKDWKR